MRKRRTREHVIADLSVHHVEGFVLRCGWTVERKRHDYGLDLLMETYNTAGEVENDWVWFQLKATDSLKKSADGKVILLRLEWRDLLFWLNDPAPIILVLYDAQEDRAYWLYVQEYFRRHRWAERAGTATTVTVHIPMDNVLDETAIRLFARFRDERPRRK
jgi:Domain of unknown function (DUF4365)